MRRDHYRRCFHRASLLADFNASGAQLGQHRFVVDQVAQDRERLGLGLFQCQGNGVADPEAHAEIFCTNDFHTLCVTKYVTI